MQWFYNLKIAAKIIICFAIIAVIAGVVGLVGIININSIKNADALLYEENALGLEYAGDASALYQRLRYNAAKMMVLDDQSLVEETINKLDNFCVEIDSLLKKYKDGIVNEEDRLLFSSLEPVWEEYKGHIQEIIKLERARQSEQAEEIFFGDADSISNTLQESFDRLSDYNSNGARIRSGNNAALAKNATLTMLIVVAVSIIIAIVLGLFVSRIIGKPIIKMVSVAERIADGDINVNIDAASKDEIGVLANAYKKMINAIKATVQETVRLTNEAADGNLTARGNTLKLNGEYAAIIKGINNTLDNIHAPLEEAKSILNRMAQNDYTVKMTGQYKGELKEFAEDINAVLDRLLSVEDAFERVGKGDTTRLEEFEKAGKRSENDRLMPACVSVMKAVRNIINETAMIAKAAVNGDLGVRGNSGKFEGGYKEIIEGFNKTIDAVIAPIEEASDVLQVTAEGNLTVNIKGDYKGEYAKIKNAVNHTIEAFNEIMNEINSASQQVSAGAKQVSDSSIALSQGSTEQASSIEELTSSLEEISEQTNQNAKNADKANELAGDARSIAVQGNDQMKEMLSAMDEINISSSNIYKIIKVIDDIAFQTNILALNAAVEAARAGQHGKGFAVVAEEVRTLAARSANAAKETTDLIEGSIQKVEAGTKIANNTAEALNKIVNEIENAANLVQEIAIASNEQAAGIGQINQGIMQVSEVVQTNSATSEESAAASEELSSQAELLKEMVGRVKLKAIDKSGLDFENLNPEVLKMLEEMADRKKAGSDLNSGEKHKYENKENPADKKIVLSDNEFGKY